jgi:hypothetical protein
MLGPEGYVSDDPLDDSVLVTLTVGEDGGVGGDNFQVNVCTARGLAKQVADRGAFVPRGYLIVERMDLGLAVEYLRLLFESPEFESWSEAAEKLSGLAEWEFEGYEEGPFMSKDSLEELGERFAGVELL